MLVGGHGPELETRNRGLSMDLLSKKIYCTRCKKLVRSSKQSESETTTILCRSCGTAIYSWDGVSWKYIGG